MPKRIGITGGIGAGKSTVSKIIESMGFPVFNSDDEAKIIINSHPEVKKELVALFGASIYTENGLNRPKLAELIFSNPNSRDKVNASVHPRVRRAFDQFVTKRTNKLVFNEAAILFETGAYKQFDSTILIISPLELRIERLLKRDKTTRSEIEARMNAQWTDIEKQKLATFVIHNDEEESLILQIEKVITELIN